MAKEFRLPDIGEGLTEAEVVRWLVPVGEPVAADQPVVEVETDKAVVEIPSPHAGIVLHHGAAEGQVVAVGQILVVIGEEGEEWTGEAEAPPAAPIVGTLVEEPEELTEHRSRRVQALPRVRKLAKELGVDLADVEGSGPGGRITLGDVEAATAPSGETPAVEPAPLEATPPGEGRRTLSKLRRTIAANMARSWSEIPHVTTFDAVDATRLLAARRALRDRHGTELPLEALLVKAVLPALREFPELNATLRGDELILHPSHDVGIAVDAPDGLVVAVIRDAGRLGVLDLAAAITRLAEGARDRSLPVEELTGQTFTVSNIGALGGGFGTPIVPPDTTAILSVGRATDRAVVRRGAVAVASMLPLSLSYDHRVVDGGLGRRFMALLMENLEEPALFLA